MGKKQPSLHASHEFYLLLKNACFWWHSNKYTEVLKLLKFYTGLTEIKLTIKQKVYKSENVYLFQSKCRSAEVADISKIQFISNNLSI